MSPKFGSGAVGEVLRVAGSAVRVVVVEFIKGNDGCAVCLCEDVLGLFLCSGLPCCSSSANDGCAMCLCEDVSSVSPCVRGLPEMQCRRTHNIALRPVIWRNAEFFPLGVRASKAAMADAV